MKKIILIAISLGLLPNLNALTKKDVEDCFAEAKIGYGLYKAFHAGLAENPDIEHVRRWVQDENNVRPGWKRGAFLECLNRKLGGAGAVAIRPVRRPDTLARPIDVGVREGGAAFVPRALPVARELVQPGERRLIPAGVREVIRARVADSLSTDEGSNALADVD